MKEQKAKKVSGFIFMAIGLLSIIFSIIFFKKDIDLRWFNGSGVLKETYGGDAYTGIQNAVADTANNIRALSLDIEEFGLEVLKMMNSFFGYILLVVGLLIFAIGVRELLKNKKETCINGVQSIMQPQEKAENNYKNIMEE
ncbi:MAG: hypothetical protein IKD47_00225 [Clostridia bacterium]|nr:hypothetical protein [Clostridia bacterium]